MLFANASILFLLLLVPVAGVITWILSQGSAGRKILLALTRMLCLAAAILALARPMLLPRASGRMTVAVVDLSPSVSDRDARDVLKKVMALRGSIRPPGKLTTIAFGNRVEVIDPALDDEQFNRLREQLKSPLFPGDPKDGGSALASALQLAAATCASGKDSQILLYTDGNATRGDALAEVWKLSSRGIALKAEAIDPQSSATVAIDRVELPPSVGAGETIPLQVNLRATIPQAIRLEVLQPDGKALAFLSQEIPPGDTSFELPVAIPSDGLNTLLVKLMGENANAPIDQSPAACFVRAPYPVILVAGPEDRGTPEALAKLLGSAARIQRIAPGQLEDPTNLREKQLLILANVPADLVSQRAQQNIIDAVSRGSGLLVTGGTDSFGPGGWNGTALAEILPVRMPQQLERQDPSATAVFIIDTSGSMTGPRISLAKEVVRLALRRLQPQDKAGIVEFYGSKRWAAPIQSAANHLDLNRALNRLTPGGGTVILPAIEEASYAMKNVNTRTRHVVILTDGGVESGPFESLTRKMADDGMTVSTVLVGPGQHSEFLASIAQWGRGRFYHAPDRFALPEIILHQPQSNSPPPLVQTPSQLVVRDRDDVTNGIDFASAPSLQGYVRTEAKPLADVLLAASGRDPVLSRWRYGAGRVAVLSTDLASTSSSDFARWQSLATLVSNLCRSLQGETEMLNIRPIVRAAGLEIDIASTRDPSTDTLKIDLLAGGKPVRTQLAQPIKAGRWNVLLKNLEPGSYEISASAGAATSRAGVCIPAPKEMSIVANEDFFKQASEINAAASSAASDRERTLYSYRELWRWLVGISMAMFLCNIYVRRRPFAKIATRQVAMVAIAMLSIRSFAAPPATTQSVDSPVAIAMEQGDLDAAEKAAKISLDGDPQNAQLLSQLGAIYEMSGDDARAIELWRQATERGKSDASALRLALLQLDLKQDVASIDPRFSLAAAVYGKYDLIAGQMRDAKDSNDPAQLLLYGTTALRLNDPARAQQYFSLASPLFIQPRDRRFVAERLMSAARDAGTLNQLADAWIEDSKTQTDKLLPLISVLRELNRVDDILAVWRRPTSSQIERDILTSPRLVAEVLAATRDAQRVQDAETICRQALANEPQSEQWLTALASILLEEDRIDEADALLTKTGAAAQSAASVLRIVHAAQSLGRDDVAAELGLTLKRFGKTNEISGLLLQAQIELHRGNRDVAVKALNDAASLAGDDAKQLSAVGEMFEQSGDRARAIELYRKSAQGGEDVKQRLAWMLEQDGKLAEAQALWQNLCQTAGSPARRREAQQRLLDLSSRTGTTADLALEIEDRLAAGRATGDDLSVLIDIYTGAKDPAAAAEILSTYKHLAGLERDSLDQLAKLYLKCGRFGQADRALRQLLQVDPSTAIDTLQEIAVLAIERRRPVEAQAALQEIARLSGTDSSTAELRAGVYEQLGMFADAAREYRRAVQVNPDQVEDWVLWAAAMNEAGEKDRAINRLLLLAQEAEGDDLFTIAIDGLLNLEAPREKLRVARRSTIERLARNPKKLVFYQLVRDLSETIGDNEMALRAGELSLLIAGEQRTEIIRELITLCKSMGAGQRSLELGRTLLVLGDQVPPSSLLDIGRQLLQERKLAEADRAFARAIEIAGDDSMRMQVARMYESAGETRLAVEALHPVIRLHPSDIELRARAGGMHEQLGEHAAAFEHYLAALDVLLKRGNQTVSLTSTTKPSRSGASMSEGEQFVDGLTQGLIICARDLKLQTRVLELVSSAVDRELGVAPTSKSVPKACVERASLLRRFAFALHQPRFADECDRMLATKFPSDNAFAQAAIAARVDWGLIDSARELAVAMNQPMPEAIKARVSSVSITNPDEAASIIPVLIMQGKVDEARALLQSVERKATLKKATIQTLLAASISLADTPSCDLWAGILLGQAEKLRGERVNSAEITAAVRSTWGAMSKEARLAALTRIKLSIEKASDTDKPALALLAMRMAVALNEPAGELAELAAAGVSDGAALHEVLRAVPPAQQPAIIEKAITAIPAEKRRAALLQLLAAADEPLNAELLVSFQQFFAAASEVTAVDRREQLSVGNWTRARSQTAALKFVAETLLKEAKDDAQIKIAAARALVTCGDQEQADAIASEVIKSIVTGNGRNRLESRVVAEAVAVLSPSAAEQLLAELPKTDAKKKSVPVDAMLLEQVGRKSEALEAYRRAFLASPSDMELRRLFTDRLESDYRWADIIREFEPFLNDETVVNQPQRFRLMKAYRQLGRHDEAAQMMFKEDGPLKQLQRLQMGVEAGETDSLLPEFRSFHVDNRWQRRSFTPYMQPLNGAGGLVEFKARHNATTARISIYDQLSGVSWAYDELSALLNAAVPNGNEVATLSAAIGKACTNDAVFAKAMDAMESERKSSALGIKDRQVLISIARNGKKLPASLNEVLVQALELTDANDVTTLSMLADAWRSSGDSLHADAIGRWIAAIHIMGVKPTSASRVFDSLDDTIVNDKWLLEASLPSPADNIEDARLAETLQQLATIDLSAAEGRLELLRNSGRVNDSQHSRLAATWARFAAERGDIAAFSQRSADQIEFSTRRSIVGNTDELRDLLPAKVSGEVADILLTQIRAKATAQPVYREPAVRVICRLGAWCAENALPDRARACLDAAKSLSTTTGEHSLWIADLARTLGDTSSADSIESELQKRSALPPPRLLNSR